MNNYVVYHLHDDQGSVLDSCTKWNDYVDKAKEYDMKAIATTNHGKTFNWTAKKQYCDKVGIKFIFGIECYLTSKLYHQKTNDKGELEDYKIADNYHTILLARNYQGIVEINNLISKSSTKDYLYFKPRITFDDFLNLSDNVITTSACLASPLYKYPHAEDFDKNMYDLLCKKYDYYEIQYHDGEQVAFNKYLYDLSKKYHKPLIAGTDTHSLNSYKAECRKILQISKRIMFENDYDLTFKSYDELVDKFKMQNSLPESVWMEAIKNTNRLADDIEDFTLDTNTKYPILTGSPESDATTYIKTTKDNFVDKVNKGIIPQNEIEQYNKDIPEELAVFKKTNMLGFMLSMADILTWAKNEAHIPFGPSRGSCAGSRTAFVNNIIDLDPVKWNTSLYRFANPERVEIGDCVLRFHLYIELTTIHSCL